MVICQHVLTRADNKGREKERSCQMTLHTFVCKTQHAEKLQTCFLPKKCAERERLQCFIRTWKKVTTAGPQHTGNERQEQQAFTEAEQVCGDQDTEESHAQPGETRGERAEGGAKARFTVKKGKIYSYKWKICS